MNTNSLIRGCALAATSLCLFASPLAAQTRVDLRAWQTPLKNQGGRATCTTFSAVAALESAYKRAGYGTLDLSEEFANFAVRMMLLHPNWDDTHPKSYGPQIGKLGANYRENTPGNFGGGHGTAVAQRLRQVSIPLESYMPYRGSPYATSGYGDFKFQANTNAFNLDTRNLPRRALTAPRYYGPAKVVKLTSSDATSPAKLEGILRLGYSVMWTFAVGGTRPTNGIWQPDSKAASGSHSMLIAGYDRRSRNSSQHYFIVKNSWGAAGASTSEGGYTRVSYAYLRKYGSGAGFISVVKKPAPWPELAFLGRRNISFDGWKGTLDVFRVPGINRELFDQFKINYADRRLGSFTDQRGVIHRLNGELKGNRMVFWFNSKKPNIRWDERRLQDGTQRRFVYYMVDPSLGEIAGTHHSNAGTLANPAYGGYARVPNTPKGTNGFLRPKPNSYVNRPEHFLGRWHVRFDQLSGYLNVNFRNDSRLASQYRATYAGLECEFIEANGKRHQLIGHVLKKRPALMWISFNHSQRGRVAFHVYMHSWERGVFAGTGPSGSKASGIYGYRYGESLIPGKLSSVGLACAGTNNQSPRHWVLGTPYLGKRLNFTLQGALANANALMVAGVDLIDKGVDLRIIGAPGCLLFTTPYAYYPMRCDNLGRASFPWTAPNIRAGIGHQFTTQFASTDPRKNGLGLVTSNAYRVRLGGSR